MQESLLQESKICNFIKKETLAQVFSFEFCEISKNTFLIEQPLVATSETCTMEHFAKIIEGLFGRKDVCQGPKYAPLHSWTNYRRLIKHLIEIHNATCINQLFKNMHMRIL